jgi:hypothetical protein
MAVLVAVAVPIVFLACAWPAAGQRFVLVLLLALAASLALLTVAAVVLVPVLGEFELWWVPVLAASLFVFVLWGISVLALLWPSAGWTGLGVFLRRTGATMAMWVSVASGVVAVFFGLALLAGWIGDQVNPQGMAVLRTRLYDRVSKVPPVVWLVPLGAGLSLVALQVGLTRRLAPRGWSAYEIEWATAGVIFAVLSCFLLSFMSLGRW